MNAKSNAVMTDAFGYEQHAGIRVYRISDLESCRRLFSKKMSFNIVWTVPEVIQGEVEEIQASSEYSRLFDSVPTVDTDSFYALETIVITAVDFFGFSKN